MSIIFLTEKCPCGSGKKFINCCFRLHHKYQKIYPPAKSITKNKYIVIDKTLYNSYISKIEGFLNYHINQNLQTNLKDYGNLILESEVRKQSDEWDCMHPLIIKSSQKLYIDGNYAEAAVNAFIEINARVKKLYKIVLPSETTVPDGVEAMNKVFSEKNPIIEICDRTTETGNNIHNGTRFMLVGAMSALRNPKSHSNDESATVTKEEAMRRLMFASLLMYKIDDSVKHSGIAE